MDVVTVREAFNFAREHAIAKGPLVMELATYRYGGHSMSDPGESFNSITHNSLLGTSYRTREEVQEVRKHRDPITGFKDRILTAGLVTEEELKELDKEVRKEVDEATNVATSEGVLPPEAVYSDLFANTEAQVVRGCTVDETIVQPYTTTAEILTKMGRTPKTY